MISSNNEFFQSHERHKNTAYEDADGMLDIIGFAADLKRVADTLYNMTLESERGLDEISVTAPIRRRFEIMREFKSRGIEIELRDDRFYHKLNF